MAKHHSPQACVELFRKGFVRGVSKRAIPYNPPGLREDEDFLRGYEEGGQAFLKAMFGARKRYKAAPPVILRMQKATEGVIFVAALPGKD